MEKKINQVAFILTFLETGFVSYSIVYILKFLNEMLTVQQLSTSITIGTLMSALTLQVAKNKMITELLKKWQITLVIINDTVWIAIALLLFIDPFAYLIANAIIIKGVMITSVHIAGRYLANATFQGDAKAAYENMVQQAQLLGSAIGSGLCMVFGNLHVYTAIWILIGSTIVLTPLMVYKIHLMRRYIRGK